jgi:hypothetical protein
MPFCYNWRGGEKQGWPMGEKISDSRVSRDFYSVGFIQIYRHNWLDEMAMIENAKLNRSHE